MDSGALSLERTQLSIIMPVYNDWAAFEILLSEIEATMPADLYDIEVLAVDDCSEAPSQVPTLGGSISKVTVVRLQMNVGHQRAIAVGLVYLSEQGRLHRIAVMDSDGEDTPAELRRMLDESAARPTEALVAKRSKRSETLGFRFFYALYTRLFQLLTGQKIDFGNFSLLLPQHVDRLVHNANIWNNFAATIIQSKVRLHRLPTVRGTRYSGSSHMNLISLVTHGLGAISVFSDAVFVRVAIASLGVLGLMMLLVLGVLGVRLFTDLAVPGWTTNVLGFAVLLSAQMVLLPMMVAFLVLNNRSTFQDLPKDHAFRLIDVVIPLYARP